MVFSWRRRRMRKRMPRAASLARTAVVVSRGPLSRRLEANVFSAFASPSLDPLLPGPAPRRSPTPLGGSGWWALT